jgi:hypothetical protein
VTDDGLHLCRGEPQPGWKRITREPDSAGFFHYRREDDRSHLRDVHQPRHKPRHSPKPAPNGKPKDWPAEAKKFAEKLTSDHREELAQLLQLPVEALDAFPLLGFTPYGIKDDETGQWVPAWTYPLEDGQGNIIGLGKRYPRTVSIGGGPPTNKSYAGGGDAGLCVPAGWRELTGPVYLVEGWSNVLALWTCDLTAIGRPSNMAGAEPIAELLRDLPADRVVIVVGDNDARPDATKPEGIHWPGKDGAIRTAERLSDLLGRHVPWALPPEGVKDSRAWVIDQATGAGESVDWAAIGRTISAYLVAGAAPPAMERPSRFTFIDSAEFLHADYRQESFISKILVRGQPGVIAGPSKGMKTSMLVDMAVSLAAAAPFLGEFPVPRPVRVALVSGESGQATLQETAWRVIRAKNLDPEQVFSRLQWSFTLPQLPDLVQVAEFTDTVKQLEVEAAILDPTYLSLGGQIDHANFIEMGAVFRGAADVLLAAGVTPFLAHHANRQLHPGEPMELRHLAYSGLEQFARQWVLLNRQCPYRGDGVHDLWFGVGGSAGHGGLWDLHIEEGVADEDFKGRRWEVTVKTTGEAVADRIEQREAKQEETARKKKREEETKVLDAIDAIVTPARPAATKNRLMERCPRFSSRKLAEVLDRLIEAGLVEESEFTHTVGKNTQRTDTGYRRVPRSG